MPTQVYREYAPTLDLSDTFPSMKNVLSLLQQITSDRSWGHQPALKLGHQPIRNHYFPSWSWAGWTCPVNFKLPVDIFQVTRSSVISCRADIYMVNGMGPIRYIGISEIQAWASNAQKFSSGKGRMIKHETGPALDIGSNVIGIFFDTEIPTEPRKSSCWLIALFIAMR
jgi:hypothetical protein